MHWPNAGSWLDRMKSKHRVMNLSMQAMVRRCERPQTRRGIGAFSGLPPENLRKMGRD
jgi:hypothetical protein